MRANVCTGVVQLVAGLALLVDWCSKRHKLFILLVSVVRLFGNLTYRVDMISRWRIHLQWARLHHGHFHSEFVDVMHTLSCVGSIAHAGRLMGSPESTVKVVKI